MKGTNTHGNVTDLPEENKWMRTHIKYGAIYIFSLSFDPGRNFFLEIFMDIWNVEVC
jgi:hypothetical protein